MTNTPLASILLFGYAALARPETLTLSGIVVDGKGNPKTSAEVTADQAKQPAYTTSTGKFVLRLRENATTPVTVRVTARGCQGWSDVIDIPQTVPLPITLTCDAATPAPKPAKPAKQKQDAPARQHVPTPAEQALKSPDAATRLNALKVLAANPKAALPAVRAIAEAMKDSDLGVRTQAVALIEKLHPNDDTIRDELRLLLRDVNIGCGAASALRAMGAPDLVSSLKAVAGDSQAPAAVRVCAAALVVDVTHAYSEEVYAAIAAGLNSKDTQAFSLATSNDAAIRRLAGPLGSWITRQYVPDEQVRRMLQVLSTEPQGRLAFDEEFSSAAGYAQLLRYSKFDLTASERELLRHGFERWKNTSKHCLTDEAAEFVEFVDRAQELRWMTDDEAAVTLEYQLFPSLFCPEVDWQRKQQNSELITAALRKHGDAAIPPLRKELAARSFASSWAAISLYILTRGTDAEATAILLNELDQSMSADRAHIDPLPTFAAVRPIQDSRVTNALANEASWGNEKAAQVLIDCVPEEMREPTATALLRLPRGSAVDTGLRLLPAGQKAAVIIVAELTGGGVDPSSIALLLTRLASMKSDAAPAVPAVTALLRTDRQLQPIETLAAIGSASAPALDQLAGILRTRTSPNRVAAARAIGMIGTSPAATAALRAAADETEPALRDAAREALAKR